MAEETEAPEQPVTEEAPQAETSPPARKGLYNRMVQDKLYNKSYDDFNKQFSSPEKVAKLHDFLSGKGKYDKGIANFEKDFFSDIPSSKPVASAGDEPVKKKDDTGQDLENGAPISTTPSTTSQPPERLTDAAAVAAQQENEHRAKLANEQGKSPIGSLIDDYSRGQAVNYKNLTTLGLSTPSAIQQPDKAVTTKKDVADANAMGLDVANIPDAGKILKGYADAHPGDKNTLPTPQGTITTGKESTFGDAVKRNVLSFDAGVIKGVGDLKETAGDIEKYTDKLLNKAGLMSDHTKDKFSANIDKSNDDFEKQSNLNLDENYVNSNPVTGIAKMIPMLMGGESNGAKIAALQAWGSAADQVGKIEKSGAKFENGSDILYKGGSALINYFLMKDVFGTTLLKSAGQDTFNGVVGKAAAEATKDLADKGINATAQNYADAYYLKALDLADKIKFLGMGAVKTYAKVGADFAAANLAETGVKAAVNAMNKIAPLPKVTGEEIEKDVTSPFYNSDTPAKGSLKQFVTNLISSPAAAFSALHLAQSSGMLFDKSPYLSPVITDLQKDNSPEAVQSIKDQLAKYGKDNNWNQNDIFITQAKVDELADIANKIPKDLHPQKFEQAVNLILDRRHLEGVADAAKARKSTLDPAISDKATQFEELINANIDQANDRLNVLITDKPFTYFEHQGEYFKVQQDGEPMKITKARYDLEGVQNERYGMGAESTVMPEGEADKKGNPIPEKEGETKKSQKEPQPKKEVPEEVEKVPSDSEKPIKEEGPIVKTEDNVKPESPEAVTPKKEDHGNQENTQKGNEKGREENVLKPDETGDGKDHSPVFSSPDEADRHWIEGETDPEAIAAHYHRQNFSVENTADYKEHKINEYLGSSKINASDFTRFGDDNLLSGDRSLARRIDKTNSQTPLDTQAHELSSDNMEVTPQDIIDFITKYKNGEDFTDKAKTPTQKALMGKYQELTSNQLTDKRAEDAFNKQEEGFKSARVSDAARDIVESEGITPANIDKLKDMFTGFPYSQEDFDNVKRYLDEQSGQETKKPAGGAAVTPPGTKSEGVGERKEKPEKPTGQKPVERKPTIYDNPTDDGQTQKAKTNIASAKEVVAKRNAVPGGGEGIKKVKSALDEKDKKAVDEIRKRIRERLASGNSPLSDMSYSEDDDDDAMFTDGLKLTKLYFKAGIRSFSDFATTMIEDMGEDIVPYLKSFYEGGKNLPSFIGSKDFDGTDTVDYHIAKLNEVADPIEVFVDRIKDEINKGNKINITGIEGLASDSGLSADTRVHLQEYVERALIELARDIVDNPLLDDREKFDEIVKLYNKQPSLNQRSSTRVLLQQYSTPMPYAFSAGLYVDNINPKSVYDPTAGTGMLLVAFDPDKAITNEIDPKRLEILQQLGYVTTDADATEMSKPDNSVDSVMVNPPFGTAKSPARFNDYSFDKLDYIIPLNALKAMKPTGRGAIIIGGHSEYDAKGALTGGDFKFFNYLHHYYNVADVINVDGNMYQKQGTTFPTRLILINGRKEVPQDYAPGYDADRDKPVKTYEDLYNRIQERINQDENPAVLQSRVDVQLNPGDLTNGEDTGKPATKERERPGAVSGKQDNEPGRGSLEGEKPGNTGLGGQAKHSGEFEFPVGDGETDHGERQLADVPVEVAKYADGAEAGTVGPEGAGEFIPADRSLSANRATSDQLVNNEKVAYTPASRLTEAGSVIPSNMAYETEQNLKDLENLYGPIDTFVANELGYHDLDDLNKSFFAEQVDAIAMGIHQLKNGKGMIIGDMTGIGKGRIAAGLIRWSVQQGTVPVFFTENADLFSDIYRDLYGIGSGHLVPFIVNDPSSDRDANVKRDGKVVYRAGKIEDKRRYFESGKPPHGTKVILSTYSQLNSAKQTLKRGFINNIAKDGYIFFDESHNMAGESNVGAYFQELLPTLKGAAFFSATYAKRADNMPVYALKTSMSDANMSSQALIEAIQMGGNAMQEIVASQLVKAGQMMRRERDFTGVESKFTTLGVDNNGKQNDIGTAHRELADQVIDVCNSIINFEKEHVVPAMQDLENILRKKGQKLSQTKSKSLSVSNTPFASKMFNIVNQMLFSIKAPELANEAIRQLKEEKCKPVIAFNSTMESFINNQGYNVGDEVKDVSFSASLLHGLKNTLKYRIEYPNGEKEVDTFDIKDLDQEAQDTYAQVVKMISEASADMSISPIDTMREILDKAGLKVGEITGRSKRLVFNEDHTAATVEGIGSDDKDKAKIIHDFNNGNGGGRADVILLNAAGATGFSMHADKSFKDQRQRVMINGQFELDINKEIQKRGRIDRTNQVKRGKYLYLVTSIPAETRLAMMVSDKLKKLQANTAADQKSKANEMKVTDFLNEYGDHAITNYLINHPDIYDKLYHGADPAGIKNLNPGDKIKPVEGIARRTTGRAALLKVAEQETFYNDVAQDYNDYVDYLNSTDQNTLSVKSVNLEAKVLSSGTYIQGTHTQSPFGQDSIINKVEANVLRKPLSKEELETQIAENLDGMTPREKARSLENAVVDYYSKRLERDTEHYNEQFEKRDKKDREKAKGNIELYKVAKADNEKTRQENIDWATESNVMQSDKMKGLFQNLITGSTMMVPTTINEAGTQYTKGVFMGFTFKEKHTHNPFAPSNVIMKFAVLDGKRTISVPASRNEFIEALHTGEAMHAGSPELRKDLRNNWEEEVKNTKAREDRYIITGNILQAFRPNMGQLISYTTSEGAINKGILMPKGFDPSAAGKLTSAVSMYDRIMALSPGGEVESSDGNFKIGKIIGNDRYFRVEVPKSTKMGGKYFKNPALLDIVEYGEFESIGDKMVARVASYHLIDLLKAVEKEFSMKFKTAIDMKETGSEQHSDSKVSNSTGLIPRNSGELKSEPSFVKSKSTERIQAESTLPGGPVGKLPDLISKLAEGLNVKIYYARSKRSKAAGSYSPSAGGIKLSTVGNLDVAVHEAGHAIDDEYQVFDTITGNNQSQIMDELQWFADRGGSNPPKSASQADKIEYLKREGIAEFIRAYAINNRMAQIKAPLFYGHFESVVPEDVLDVIKDFGQDYLRYINGTSLDHIMANIEEVPKEDKSAYRKFIDTIYGDKEGRFQLTPFDKLQIRLTNSGHGFDKSYDYILGLAGGSKENLLPEQNAVTQSLLFAGVDGKIGSFFDNGIVNGKNEPIIDGRTGQRMNMEWLLNVFDTTSEETLRKDQALTIGYLFSMRTIEKAMQFDRPNDISGISAAGDKTDTDIAIKFLVKEFGQELSREQKKRVLEGGRRYQLWADKMLNYMVDKGRMSKDTYRAIKEKNLEYVAFLPVQENAPGIETSFDSVSALTRSANIGSVKNIIKEMTGSTMYKRHPYISLMQNTASMIREADRNEILQSYIEPMANAIRSMGQGSVNPFANVMMEVSAAEKVQGKPVISVYLKGEAKFYMFSDDAKDVYNYINGLTKLPQLPWIAKALPNLLRWTATRSPVFAKNHFIRSTFNRLLISRTAGLGTVVGNKINGEKELYALYGGSQNGYWMGNRVDYYKLQNQVIKDLSSRGKAIVISPSEFAKKGWKAYMDLLHKSDLANRTVEFRTAYEKAKKPKSKGGLGFDEYNSLLYASLQAKDLLNASVAGTWMKYINALIPFSNVEIQGLKRNIKAAGEGNFKGLGLWAIRMGLYTIIPALLMRMLSKMGGYEEDYDNLPAYQRDLGYNFKLPGMESWIYIPKPYDSGLISSGIDRAIGATGAYGENAWAGYDKTLYQDLFLMKPELAVGPLSAIVEPITNYSFFKQGPIVPRYEENKILFLRHNFNEASRLGKVMSEGVSPIFKEGDSVDPRYIDNTMQNLFSYYGDWAMSLSDIGSKESRHKFGLKTTGFIKDQQISGDVRVEKVYNLAKELGLDNTKPIKELSGLIRAYYNETTPEGRKKLHSDIIDLAKNTYHSWQENKIYQEKLESKGKKINFN